MKLRTEIPIDAQNDNRIDYHSKTLLLGSCFSDNIGEKLAYFKFQNLKNPFGILFNPKAIETLITNAVNQKKYSDEDVFFHNEQWHCFEVHSKLSDSDKEVCLKNLNSAMQETNQLIHESTHIVITLGTAWVYRFLETKSLVANCHKVPQKQFTKELLSVDEISKSLETIVHSIRSVNSQASIIFTVSPVRHIKDGFIENTRSKALLITAIHNIIKKPRFGGGEVYFPSYEIMMDELRDYRFYSEDMLHPNQTAINYIWEKFEKSWIHSEASKIMNDVDVIQKGLQHRPFNPNSNKHNLFLQNLERKKKQLITEFPFIAF